MVCDKENGVCYVVLCERSCVCVKVVCVKDGVCDKAVCERWCVAKEHSCDCTKRKVHCWIRKCKPAQNMN